MRGDKVGIIGPNGAGKTTLLRILLGDLAAQSGSVRLGTNLQVAYFDQLRGPNLMMKKPCSDNVCPTAEQIRHQWQTAACAGVFARLSVSAGAFKNSGEISFGR